MGKCYFGRIHLLKRDVQYIYFLCLVILDGIAFMALLSNRQDVWQVSTPLVMNGTIHVMINNLSGIEQPLENGGKC